MMSAPPVQTPDVNPQVHRPERRPMVTMRRRMTGEAEIRFWANRRSNS